MLDKDKLFLIIYIGVKNMLTMKNHLEITGKIVIFDVGKQRRLASTVCGAVSKNGDSF